MEAFIEDPFLVEVSKSNRQIGKSPYPNEVLIAFKKRISQIYQAKNTADLRQIKSLHFEKLKGLKYEGKYSIRLNKAYRIIFRINTDRNSRLEILYIEEINNHYS